MENPEKVETTDAVSDELLIPRLRENLRSMLLGDAGTSARSATQIAVAIGDRLFQA